MTLQMLERQPNLQLLRCISGSKAYGTNLAHSDTDIKGVFIIPQKTIALFSSLSDRHVLKMAS